MREKQRHTKRDQCSDIESSLESSDFKLGFYKLPKEGGAGNHPEYIVLVTPLCPTLWYPMVFLWDPMVFGIPWSAARQAPLSLGFSRQ